MMLHFPTYGVSLAPSLRGLGDVFSGSSSSCIASDGVTIDSACVAAQSNAEGQHMIQYQDDINSQDYANCEANLALNNAQRQGNGQPLLPDNCASQFPANANETVYTGYNDITSGSGSQGGATGFSTAPVVNYNPAPAYAPIANPNLNMGSGGGSGPSQGQLPTTASKNVSNPLLGTSNMPTPTATGTGSGADIMLGSFDLTQNWMWVAGGAGAIILVMMMGKK